MALEVSIDWGTGVINVAQSGLTLVQSTPFQIREMNINEFRLVLKDLEDDPTGMPYLKTHSHNTEVNLGGVVYARVVEILDPYSITFEDAHYAVNLYGANSNVGDKVNVNSVSVRSANSAGLTNPVAGQVWNALLVDHVISGTLGRKLGDIPDEQTFTI